MRGLCLAVAALWPAIALGQSPTTSSSSATQTVSGENTVHTVTVAEQGDFAFSPQSLLAIPGDIVLFEFGGGNHSVIKANYGYPCVPFEDVTGGQGFYSGFQAVTNSTKLTWSITINTTDPVWYYCGAPGSCIGHGMLGVINPDADQSLSTQIMLAREANYMLEPGQPIPQEALYSISSLAASATTATVTTSATSAPATTTAAPSAAASSPAVASHSSSHLSTGAIAGIAVAGAVVAIGAAVLFFFLGRHRSMKSELTNLRRQSAAPPEMRGGGDGAGFMTYTSDHDKHQSQLPPYPSLHQDYYKSPGSPPISEMHRTPYPETDQYRYAKPM